MSTLTFSGTPSTAYSVPAGYVASGSFIYNAAGNGILTLGDFSFCTLRTDVTISAPRTISAVINKLASDGDDEAGISFVNSSGTGFAVILYGTTFVLRKEVAGSGGATITTGSIPEIVGESDLLMSFDNATGDISVTYDGSVITTGVYTDTLTGLYPRYQNYKAGTVERWSLIEFNGDAGIATSIDSVTTAGNPGLVVGQQFAMTTTGLDTITSVTAKTVATPAAITSAISLSLPAGDGVGTMKGWVDGEYYPFIGTVSVVADDGTLTGAGNFPLALPADHVAVTFASVEISDNTYIGYWLDAMGHPLANGDVGYYDNVIPGNSLSVAANSKVSVTNALVFTLWVHKLSGIIESYTVTVNDAGEVTDSAAVTSRGITSRSITSRAITSRSIV